MRYKKGVNKFGIKLEDHVDYASYRRACYQAYKKSPKGKLVIKKHYKKHVKNHIKKAKNFRQSVKGKLYFQTYKKITGRTIINALSAKRRAAKLQRTPAWADLKAIKQFYLNCPKGYEVDHIVPLQGVNVSGFHVLNNLQYLTKSENSSKGNRYAV